MKISSRQVRRVLLSYLLSVGFWTLLAILMAWQQYTIQWTAGSAVPLRVELLLFSAKYFTFALLTPPIFYLIRRFAISRNKLLRGVIAYLFGLASFVISYACIRWTIAPLWSIRLQRLVPRSLEGFKDLLTGTLGDLTYVYIAIVIAAHAYAYFERSRTQELEQHELQRALAASELQTLKSQLHPHFLFNTLHGISTLVDTDRALAKAMVLELSSLLRAALQHGSADLITLQEEIRFIESYLDLEKMRLGTRLEVRWKIGAETSEVLVPQMILQPLVENAILHGISCCREGGWLEIASQRADGRIKIRVQNSVGGKGQKGMGLGLKNTISRLKYLYSEEAAFTFALADTHVATATLVLPALDSQGQSPPVAPLGTQNEG